MLSKEKFTRQFNVICDRVSFWESMAAHLAMFEGLVHRREYLTHEDRKTLRRIHDVLYESYETCYEAAQISQPPVREAEKGIYQ